VVLALTASNWAVTTTTMNAVVVAEGEGPLQGELAVVTPMAGSFTVQRGAAQVIAGVELFKIEIGAPRFSNLLKINVLLLNPQDMGGVLGNPKAHIDVAVWYEDENSTHTLSDGTTKVSKDEGAAAKMTRVRGEALLQPAVANQDTLYILASIIVPGGNAPPGQQGELTELGFWCDVRR
jgi:hypothetical protein